MPTLLRGSEVPMDRFLWVCLGSAVGGGARYLISQGAMKVFGTSFPFGTLVVNVTGSFLIGLTMQVALSSTLISPTARIFLTTGVLGGLTTYSTFNYETLALARDGVWEVGFINVAVTVCLCLVSGVLGIAAGRLIVGERIFL
jgi:CrcB protein